MVNVLPYYQGGENVLIVCATDRRNGQKLQDRH